MPESQFEMVSRLRAMTVIGQQTWDLSANDERAIGFALSAMPNPRLVEALEAVLMFYNAGPWTSELQLKWNNLTESADATTKGLCDFIRKRIAEPFQPHMDSLAKSAVESLTVH